jgi:hypothetical protein
VLLPYIADLYGSSRGPLDRAFKVSAVIFFFSGSLSYSNPCCRFIKDHFAESFQIAVPGSPPRYGGQEQKWISSATLLEAPETDNSPPQPPVQPRTPEQTFPFKPSFSLMTPSGQSPHSLKSSPSIHGSPLTDPFAIYN